MSEQQIQLVDQEISELLENGSIQPFSCGKEGWGKPFTDKSEKTQYIHPLQALQIKGLHCLEFPVQKSHFLCKIHLKDTYFAIL